MTQLSDDNMNHVPDIDRVEVEINVVAKQFVEDFRALQNDVRLVQARTPGKGKSNQLRRVGSNGVEITADDAIFPELFQTTSVQLMLLPATEDVAPEASLCQELTRDDPGYRRVSNMTPRKEVVRESGYFDDVAFNDERVERSEPFAVPSNKSFAELLAMRVEGVALHEARNRAQFALTSLCDYPGNEAKAIVEAMGEHSLREIINATAETKPHNAARRIIVEVTNVELFWLDEQFAAGGFNGEFYKLARTLHINHAADQLRKARRRGKQAARKPPALKKGCTL